MPGAADRKSGKPPVHKDCLGAILGDREHASFSTGKVEEGHGMWIV